MTGEDNRTLRKVMGTAISLGLVFFLLLWYLPSSYAQTNSNVSAAAAHINASPLVYHLSSSDPWRASIAVSDATAMKNLGHNVTLLLSIEEFRLEYKIPIIT
jgi:hypothetical protein